MDYAYPGDDDDDDADAESFRDEGGLLGLLWNFNANPHPPTLPRRLPPRPVPHASVGDRLLRLISLLFHPPLGRRVGGRGKLSTWRETLSALACLPLSSTSPKLHGRLETRLGCVGLGEGECLGGPSESGSTAAAALERIPEMNGLQS